MASAAFKAGRKKALSGTNADPLHLNVGSMMGGNALNQIVKKPYSKPALVEIQPGSAAYDQVVLLLNVASSTEGKSNNNEGGK